MVTTLAWPVVQVRANFDSCFATSIWCVLQLMHLLRISRLVLIIRVSSLAYILRYVLHDMHTCFGFAGSVLINKIQ